jgi:RimJ/RimL family protein N-acetyltransferase
LSAADRPVRPPVLETERLRLRPLEPADAPRVSELAGDRDVARNTLRIPHPYPEDAAEQWIAALPGMWERGEEAIFALTLREGGELVGAAGIHGGGDGVGEIGYWIGRPYWGRGYATEAARALVSFGFDGLGLERVWAHSFGRNPASCRVLEKAGLVREGTLRRHVRKWEELEDVVCYGLLREEWEELY